LGADQERLRQEGRPILFADAWIAAAALRLNVSLVTHNASDYRAVENLTILTAAVAIWPEVRSRLATFTPVTATRSASPLPIFRGRIAGRDRENRIVAGVSACATARRNRPLACS